MEVIDFRTRPRTPYFYRDLVPRVKPHLKSYVKMYNIEPRLSLTSLSESIREMNSSGVTHGVIFAANAEGNREVYNACRQHPEFYTGLAGVDLSKGATESYMKLEQAYEEFRLAGLTLSPCITGIYSTDPRCYPLYALSEKLGKMVQIHSSIHFIPHTSLDMGNPMHLDKIAVDFPKLRLVMSHAGIGFGEIGISVVTRHPNMFMDFTGLHPKRVPAQLLQAINTVLRKKAIFGTNYPSFNYDIVEEWKKVIHKDNHHLFFHENAARALGVKR